MGGFMRFYTKIALGALISLAPAASYAATATTSITINADVVATCTVTAAPLNFTSYSGAVVNTTTTISPNCSNGTGYTIAIDTGAGVGATVASRKLTNGASQTLNYTLYTTVGATVPWGTTTGTDTVAGTGNGSTQTVSVFGRIFAGQSSAVGTGYTDTVGVTLTF